MIPVQNICIGAVNTNWITQLINWLSGGAGCTAFAVLIAGSGSIVGILFAVIGFALVLKK